MQQGASTYGPIDVERHVITFRANLGAIFLCRQGAGQNVLLEAPIDPISCQLIEGAAASVFCRSAKSTARTIVGIDKT